MESIILLQNLSSLSLSKKIALDSDIVVSTLNNFTILPNIKFVSLYNLDKETFMFEHHSTIKEEFQELSIKEFENLSSKGIVGQSLNSGGVIFYPELLSRENKTYYVLIPLSCSFGTEYLILLVLDEHWMEDKESCIKFCELQSDFLTYALDNTFFSKENQNLKSEIGNLKHGQVVETYESQDDINTILNAIQAGVIIAFKETGAILKSNPMANKLIGTTHTELTNKPISNFLKQENNIANNHFESKLKDINGKSIDVLRKNIVTTIFGAEYLVESFIDITDQKVAQKVLERSKDELESLIKMRTSDLEYTINELESQISLRKKAEFTAESEKKYSELKTKFLLMVSHEFRTPLTIVRNNSEILKNHYDRLEKAEINKLTSRNLLVIDYLSMVLLNINKYEQVNEVKVTSAAGIKLIDVFRNKISSYNSFVDKPLNFDLNIPESLILQYSIESIAPIVENILDNVLRYSKDVVYAKITCEKVGNFHILSIEDKGIGIPETDISRVTEIFYRGENVGNIPGVGMGLALVKQILKIIGGELHIKSQLNIGTKVMIKIPIIQAEANLIT
ncbi:MAG: HAMP domain-containing sensor histidine kinase [Candidatus Kapabacteria bacterium]|nr:HAMP domain-containing sensor histidine kinase [Candidatus Kapabacteria bacterium]